MMDVHQRPDGHHGLPKWLAVCLGFVGLAEPTPRSFCDEKKVAIVEPKKPAPSKPTKPPTDWKKIPLVNDYNLIKKVGKGGFSEIWLAEHRKTKEVVALKVVQLTNADLEPDEVATLLAEAKFLRTLDCPYLVKCRAAAHTRDWLIMALEYCSGGEVLDHLHKIMKYTEADAAKLFAQVVSAISYLHNLNLIHRDIKPENVMFAAPVEECEAQGRPLRVKVIDLGMAALYDPKKRVLGCVGTPGFVAPEVWNDKPQSPAMDIYSLGVMLFIMLTGRKPHSGADIRRMGYCSKSIHDAPGLKDERFLSLSSAARELLLSMLADDPSARPSCMAVLSHPFITAVDSNKEAHREMGAEVRRRIRDLHRIRRLHGLRYAMHAHRPQRGAPPGGGKEALLEALDQRRLRLKGEWTPSRASSSGVDSDGGPPFPRCSLSGSYEDRPAQPPQGPDSVDNSCTATTTTATTHSGKALNTKGFGRPSGDGGGGSGNGKGGGDPDKLALLSALPEMRYCTTMPPRRYEGAHASELSPVPSCDPSAYGTLEEAALPRNWSAHPVMYEALAHREQLLEGLAPGPSLPELGMGVGERREELAHPLPEAPLSAQPAAGPATVTTTTTTTTTTATPAVEAAPAPAAAAVPPAVVVAA